MLSYCKKCGRVQHNIFELKTICDVCGSEAHEVPRKYIDDFRWRDGDGKQALIEELVKTSPEFDQYLFDHREEILTEKLSDLNAKLAHGKSIMEEKNSVPKCPTCQSTNIRKIGGVERGASVAMLGLFSKKINKSFKCNNCGYTW